MMHCGAFFRIMLLNRGTNYDNQLKMPHKESINRMECRLGAGRRSVLSDVSGSHKAKTQK